MKRGYSNLLSRRLLLINLASVLVAAVVLTAAVDWLVLQNNRAQILQQQSDFTEQVARRIDQGLEDRVRTLEGLSRLLHDGQALLSDKAIQDVLDSRLLLHEHFNNGLMVVNTEGVVTVDSPVLEGRVGLDVSDRAYFRVAAEAKSPHISDPVISRVIDLPVFIIAVPVLGQQQELLGVVFGATRLAEDNVLTRISAETIGERGTLWVLDQHNDLVVTSSVRDAVMSPISVLGIDALSEQLRENRFQGRAQDPQGTPTLYTATTLDHIDWLVVHTFPEAKVMAPVIGLLWSITGIVMLLLLPIALAASWLIRRQLQPLQRAAREVVGMLDETSETRPLHVERRDEVGLLVAAFNRLLEKQSVQAQQLKEAKQRADASNRAKGDFLANMSHEIRTPMNAVIGMSQLLQQTELDERQQDYLNMVLHSSRMLLGIINDILDFSKIESGRLELEERAFDLDEVIDQMATMFGGMADAKQLELLYDIQPDLPQTLIGDSLRLSQVLTNLLGNAIKFSEPGGVIKLGIRSTEPRGNGRVSLQFSVHDTGIGLSKEQITRLFQPFSQADSSTTRRYGGTGLGLVISRRLVEAMGGELIVESEPGAGSTFSFVLSLPIGPEARRSTDCPDISGARILIVDDQKEARVVMRELLQFCGFSTNEAASGEEAIRMVVTAEQRGAPFDFILMDWMMPGGMNGTETCEVLERMRQQGDLRQTRAPILMISAYRRDEIMPPEGLVTDFLSKPVTASALYDALICAESGTRRTRIGSVGVSRPPALHGYAILLVEDNEINQEVARLLLEQTGAHVRLAENGAEAVEAVQVEAPDLILMDLQMPVMDGFEATRVLRQGGFSSPIIALSAAVMDADRQRAREAGVDAHLGKPIDSEKLYALLRQSLGIPATQPQEHSAAEGIDEAVATTKGLLPERLPGFDLERGRRQLVGNEALYLRLLTGFRDKLHSEYAPLVEHLRAGASEPAQRLSHTLKGVAGTLAAVELHQLAEQINDALKQGQAVDDGLIDALEQALGDTQERLAALGQLEQASVSGSMDAVEALREHLENSEFIDETMLREALAYLRGRGLATEALEITVEQMAFDDALRLLDELLNADNGMAI